MAQQLALYDRAPRSRDTRMDRVARPPAARPLCAACRAKEARYGFRSGEDAGRDDRPRTLCFDCFRIELGYRQAIAAQRARGWNGTQSNLPLADTLAQVDRRRRRAQIAARKALELG